MKTQSSLRRALPGVAVLCALASQTNAQFTYHNQDAMAVFRQVGNPNLDLEVDLGQVSTFYNLRFTAPGSTISISSYSPTQFSTAFSSALGVDWAVMSAVPVGTGTGAHPSRTVWLTNPRLDINTQTTPFQSASGSTEGNWTSVIRGIAGAGSTAGAVPWSAGTPPDSITNSANVILIPNNDPSSYTQIGGPFGNLNGTFGQGTTENGSSSPFSLERSDFYEIQPNAAGGDSTFLGYFDLDQSGNLSFTAAPEPSTWALLGLGAATFAAVTLRRRFTHAH